MANKQRKPTPSPPRWVWWDLDNCWCCKDRHGCHNCKIMKKYKSDFQRRQRKKDKQKIRQFDF
jgi:hypothetical protein